MSFGLWKVSSCLVLAACCGFWEGRVSGQEWHGRPIEFSGSESPATTNLNRSAAQKEGLKRLERDLNKSRSMFSPNSSLEGLQAPTFYRPVPGPAIQNPRVKELIERRKNWMFASPEDMAPSSSLEETLRTPDWSADGSEKKKAPSLERFYESLDPSRARGAREGKTGSSKEDPFGARQKVNRRGDGSGRDDANLSGGLRDREQALRKLLDADTGNSPFGGGAGRGGFSDFFGLGDNRRSLEQEQAHKDYLTQYQQWLNGAQSAPANSLNPLGAVDPTRATTPSYNGLETLSGPSHRSFESTLGVINPNFNLGTLPDMNTKVLNQWNPLYTPPKFEPPRVTPPSPQPMESIPKRRFM